MFENFLVYLKFIDSKLEKFFLNQKDYIFCKKGCAKCCKNAQFPYSLMEMNYLLRGVVALDEKSQNIIHSNILRIKEKMKNNNQERFLYDCPLLIENQCSVYEYRGVICRSFGLITSGQNGNMKMPFCCYEGLNYSNVVDIETNTVSEEKYLNSGIKEEPHGFKASYDFLTSERFETAFNFRFGQKKPLIDWFENIKG